MTKAQAAAVRAIMLDLQASLLEEHDDVDTEISARKLKITGELVDVLYMAVNTVISVIVTLADKPTYYVTSPIWAGKRFNDKLKALKHINDVLAYHRQSATLLDGIDESVS